MKIIVNGRIIVDSRVLDEQLWMMGIVVAEYTVGLAKPSNVIMQKTDFEFLKQVLIRADAVI